MSESDDYDRYCGEFEEPTADEDDDERIICPHCLEPVSEDVGVEGPQGNLWHQSCLDGWREED